MDKITGTIEDVNSTAGEKNGNKWKRYCFDIDGKKYSTFDENIGEKFRKGDKVEMTGEQSGQYWNMKTMDYVDREAPTETISVPEKSEVADLLRQILAELKYQNEDEDVKD